MAFSKRGNFESPTKSPYNFEKYDSDLERQMMKNLERDPEVERWMKRHSISIAWIDQHNRKCKYLPDFLVQYRDGSKAIIEVKNPVLSLRSGDRTYELASLHMHAPSEHRVEGAEFAAELHLVHADAAGDFAVVGLLFEPGEANPIVQAILDAAPATGETVAGGIALNASTCVPSGTAYYAYDGSKTTPPCDEGVAWHVMRDPLTISREQVNGLLAIGGGPTNRPIQPIGSRRIVLAGG
ncbi:MAG: carbonic anhydrase family protein [Chloroflexota bacterium]|nr:carbonic anhydrase family protein [Chloroflexota bacterium]